MRLLIAEDDLDLADALQTFLERNNYLVDVVNNGLDAYEYAKLAEYDGIILDVMMPKMDGIQALKKMRAEGINAPVMMLTAKAELNDRITGFDSGADDYLPKTFSPDELVARIRAMLRRRDTMVPTVLSFGDITLDCNSKILTCGTGEERLNAKEFQVLEMFMSSPKMVIPAEKIMESVWGWDTESDTSVVWVHISNIRKKLKAMNSTVTIKSSRGLGYILEKNE